MNNCPLWTPDGKHIVFVSEGNGKATLHWIRADGAGEGQMLLEGKTGLIPYSFSPDGRRVAFSEPNSGTGADLWTLPIDTTDAEHPKPGERELFVGASFFALAPAFSPDGHWLAYQSNESGTNQVLVRPFPASGPSGSGKWPSSTDGGQYPIWSSDGRDLFYEDLDNRIMAVAARSGIRLPRTNHA